LHLPQDYEDLYPLSGIEQGMIYHSLLMPEEPVYHDQFVYLLSINSPSRFFHAFNLLLGRHSILRSGFNFSGFQEPMKVVHRELRPHLGLIDLSTLPADERRRSIESYLRDDLADKFRFDGDLLWR